MLRHSRSTRFLYAALLSLLLVGPSAAQTATARPRPLSIAAARLLPLGTVVTVTGIASTPSGVFDSSFFDKGFAIQDASAGIFVSLQQEVRVVPRVRVTVTGVLKSSSGLLVIAPASPSAVVLQGIGPRVEPEWVETKSISEATEGRLVLVIGRLTSDVTNDLPYGHKFTVDDGSGETQIFINTQTGIDVSKLANGQLVSIIGFSSQFETHYEIDPRGPGDLSGPSF
jgi:hypothetical protein